MKLKLLFLTFLFSALSWGQATIAIQDFDGGTPNWAFSTTPTENSASCVSNGDVWNVVNTLGNIAIPNSTGNFFGGQDLNGASCGTSATGTIDFSTIDISLYNNVVLSFDYEVDGFNTTADELSYIVKVDGISQTEVFLCDGCDSQNVRGTVSVNIPNGSSNVSLQVRARFDGGSDYFGVDNFKLSGDLPSGNIITVTQATGGTITPGTTSVADGNDQAFTATADACYTFTNWVVDGVNAGNANPYTFTNVTANHAITAVYTQDTYSITATAGANGSISPSGVSVVNCGDDLSYTFTADSGYAVQDVLVDGVSVGAVTSYDFTNVTGNHTISVSFMMYVGPCLSEDFESGSSSISSWDTGGGNGVTINTLSGNDYMNFNNNGEYAVLPINNINAIDFDLAGSSSSNSWTLYIQTSSDGISWTDFSTISGGTINTSFSFQSVNFGTTVTYVRLFLQRTENSCYIDNLNVYCGPTCTPPADPVGTISGVTPACTTTTLSYSESAVAPVEFYWQTTSMGTSTANNASSPLVVTTSGDYYVRAFNTATSCWSVAEVGPYAVVISSAATITSQPANASTVENGGASFTVATTGTGLSYQWQVDTGSGFVNVTDGLQYSGSNTASLTISNATLVMDGYVYQCIVSSACGNVTSNSATLSVIAATGTTYNPGELVFVGYDGQFEGSGLDDEYLIATLVDLIPGTTFSLVNSRFEAGAPANVRTNKWGGGGDLAEEAPYVVELSYNGSTIIPAGSVLRFETNNGPFWFGRVDVTVGTTTTNRTSDFSGNLVSGVPNISTSGADQMFLIQGAFTFDGTLDANEANYYLSGTLLHGITNRAAWVPLTDACNGDDSGGNSRESRLPNDLTCFNVENSSSNAVSAFYENDKEHGIATIRQIVLALSDVNNNWTLGTGRYTIDPSSSAVNRAGKTFLIGASNPPGQWVGNVNTNWFDCANWEGLAVPKLTTNVVISSSSVRDAQVDYTAQYSDLYSDIAVCNDITISDRKLIVEGNANNVLNVYGDLVISATGVVDMDDSNAGTADGTIHLYGDWTNNVDETAFEEGNGTIHFDGTAAQIISNVAPEGTEIFYDVVMNNDFTTSVSNNLIATGDLLVVAGKTVTVNGNDYVQVNHDLTNNGIFNVLDDGSLIQVNDSGVNTGNILYQRTAMARNLDYVYWSSPVATFNVNNLPNNYRYIWNTTIANTNGGQGNWVAASGNMIAGKGYIARASNGSATPVATTTSFVGVPNNGVVNMPILRGSYQGDDYPGTNEITITRFSDNWNLVGNPYPSAINVDEFLDLNTNIEGAVRIWTHGTLPSTSINNPFYGSYQANYTPYHP